MQPEQALLVVGAAAFGAFILAAASRREIARYCAFAGCALVLMALALRWASAGRPPWAALYETAALLALITGLVAAASHRRAGPAPFSVALAAASALLLLFSAALWAPASALPEALESGWLAVHVPAVIGAYGMFASSAGASAAYIYVNMRRPEDAALRARLDRTAGTSAAVGLGLLAFGIATGAIWADAAWGSYWSWDPKETWSLITAAVYALYLGLRLRGLRGEDAAYLSLLGLLSVIFTYLGVSYLIPGLHSYA